MPAGNLDDAHPPRPTIEVLVPARDESQRITQVLEPLIAARDRNEVDEVTVIGGASSDDTDAQAAAAGARVLDRTALMPALGPSLGKGDAIHRALTQTHADLLVLIDGDIDAEVEHFIPRLTAPLRHDPQTMLVKGAFTRPLRIDGQIDPFGGGRVTELTCKPLLRTFFPELAHLRQPLSGQVAVRAEHLRRLPIWTGYGFEIGVLLDTWRRSGPAAIAEAELGTLVNRHQSLQSLATMADAITHVIARTLADDGRLEDRAHPIPAVAGVVRRAAHAPAASTSARPAR